MVKKLKSGFLNYYQRRLFGKDWRSVFCILYDDSNFAWHKDQSQPVAEGKIYIKDSPHLLAVGQHTAMVPKRPKVPPGTSVTHLMAVGNRKKDIYWFLFADDNDLNSWMSAIVSTLPPPPQANEEIRNPSQEKQPIPPTASAINPAITVPPYSAPPPYAQNSSTYNHQQQYYATQTSAAPTYGAQPYGGPVYGTQPYGTQPTQTTVIVNDSNRGYGGTDNFATGMLMGGAMGMALGSASHWGHGGGWGFGGGYGCGSGWGHDDIHIDNHVNVYNDYNFVETTTVSNDFGGGDFGGSDFDGGDFGGFDF